MNAEPKPVVTPLFMDVRVAEVAEVDANRSPTFDRGLPRDPSHERCHVIVVLRERKSIPVERDPFRRSVSQLPVPSCPICNPRPGSVPLRLKQPAPLTS